MFRFTGSVYWSICHDIHGWVCNATEFEVWPIQVKQTCAWFTKYWPCKSWSFCCIIFIVGKERWKKSPCLCRKGFPSKFWMSLANTYSEQVLYWGNFVWTEHPNWWSTHFGPHNKGNLRDFLASIYLLNGVIFLTFLRLTYDACSGKTFFVIKQTWYSCDSFQGCSRVAARSSLISRSYEFIICILII